MKTSMDIKDYWGRRIGTIETDSITGDKEARDFYGRKVGTYNKKSDITCDFYGRIVARGDCLSALIREAEAEYQAQKKGDKK